MGGLCAKLFEGSKASLIHIKCVCAIKGMKVFSNCGM